MTGQKKRNQAQSDKILLETIIEAVKNKKGKEIVSINLKKTENSVCDYFVICTGESTTQTSAIADEIKDKSRELADTSVHHIEGLTESSWVLMDYISIVVHIFLKDQRGLYQLEDLWGDGILTMHEDI
ncbi:MAG: ribosome silencing factor [Bacteroidales bacterium]|nr:ribosome silencing factor [Bacteroidales bacterium]MCF8390243.1 ribosome silencing factor [Bacteroidales bacterium]